jgi:glycosyltransferase involved in cell wall biosynthesis
VIERDVTVVVPTRNRRDVLATTLSTILNQRDVDLRVVVVDEGSSDATPDLLRALTSERLAFVRHDDPKGLAGARNAGLDRADTTWVAFCDDDDLWAPDKLAAQLTALERVPGAAWACVGSVSVDADLRVIGYHRPPPSGNVHEALRSNNAIPGGGSSVLVRAALARELGGYDAWFTGCEDFGFHCALAGSTPLAAVDRPLLGYRVWAGSMSSDVTKMRTGHERVVEQHRGDLDAELARQGDLHAEQYWARFHLRNRDRAAAFRAYVDIARRYRLPGQLAYAVWGAVSPSSADRHQAELERNGVPAEWEAAARAWLDRIPSLEPLLPA